LTSASEAIPRSRQNPKILWVDGAIAESSPNRTLRAVDQLRSQGEVIDDALLAHIAPLGWEHITFNGDYVWPTEALKNAFRPLRNPRSAFLDPA